MVLWKSVLKNMNVFKAVSGVDNLCCAKGLVLLMLIFVGRYFWQGMGGYCDFFLFFFWQTQMNLDKEIQCNEPCWDDKALRSDVLRDEMLMSFMLELLSSFPEVESQLL